MQEIKIKLLKVISVFIMFGFASCKRNDNAKLFTNSENNEYNLLHLKKSGYSFHGSEIFTINYPYPFLQKNFFQTNYI